MGPAFAGYLSGISASRLLQRPRNLVGTYIISASRVEANSTSPLIPTHKVDDCAGGPPN